MYEDDIVEEIYAYDFHVAVKDEHRKARKTKAKEKKQRKCKHSINNCIGKYASAYGKKMLHRYNRRRLDVASSDYYKHDDYSYSSILWALT